MIFYTSDLHFGHIKVAKHRGFIGTSNHDAHIVARWNERISPLDTVYVLGDVGLSSKCLDTVLALNGIKHLIAGNHDAPHPMHRDAAKAQAKWLRYFNSVQPYARRRAAGHEFLMAHHPYQGDHTPVDRDVQYRLRNYGLPILHGHVHSIDRVTYAADEHTDFISTLQIHVGLDAWGLRPVREEEVIDMLNCYARRGNA